MAKVLGKVAGLGLDEIFVAGVSKQLGERTLTNIIGNQTFMSGAIKLLLASLMPKSNKYTRAVALGIGTDGVEDIIINLIGGVGVGEATI